MRSYAGRPTPKHVAVLVLLLLGSIFWDARRALGIALGAWLLHSSILLARQPEENEGHRAGGKGFDSEPTIPALFPLCTAHHLQVVNPRFDS